MLKPLRDFLVVSAMKEDEKTPSGLLFKPSTVEEKVVSGKVLSVGSGYLLDSGVKVPLEVLVGDTVLFNKNLAVEVKHQGETVFLLREEHVLTVVQ